MRKEQKLRRAALAQVSALPRPEAEKTIERQIEDMMQQLVAKLGSIEEQLKRTPAQTDRTDHGIAQSRKDVERGNRSAPSAAADVGGATAQSANKTCFETNQDASDVEQGAVSEAQTGKRKRRRHPAEAKTAANAPPPPSAAESGDWASDPGPTRKGKPGKRHRSKGTAEKTKNRGRISIREGTQAATCWTV
jgi:hypothetical protein